MMWIDTHAHLNFPDFDGDREGTIRKARAAGVAWIVNVGTNLEVSRHAVALAAEHADVAAAAGFHPHDVEQADARSLSALDELVRSGAVVAVGETGLDFYRDYAPHDLQEEVFRWHVRLGVETGLPLIVHSRGAEDRVLDLLEAEGASSTGGVLHCFGGDEARARRAVDLNFHLGFGGTVTFRKSTSVGVALTVPEDRLLLETDCPYLAPVPERGHRNEPAFVRHTAEFLARAAGEPLEALAARTTQNAVRLFRLPETGPG